MPDLKGLTCPLCHQTNIVPYHRDKVRDYLSCQTCSLVFVPPGQHLPSVDEKAYYDLHDNRPDDPGYRHFLGRLFAPLNQHLEPASRGLDVGCGPGPTLSGMFEEAGHHMALYDPYYAPDTTAFEAHYDFITLSEVVEHMAEPGMELDRLWDRLKPGGWLGIMTKRVQDRDAFRTWHYITDPTHICYFSEAAFEWLCEHLSASGKTATMTVASNDVVLIKKNV